MPCPHAGMLVDQRLAAQELLEGTILVFIFHYPCVCSACVYHVHGRIGSTLNPAAGAGCRCCGAPCCRLSRNSLQVPEPGNVMNVPLTATSVYMINDALVTL
jgi:hypothetical protein